MAGRAVFDFEAEELRLQGVIEGLKSELPPLCPTCGQPIKM
jgi:hypothetical protein